MTHSALLKYFMEPWSADVSLSPYLIQYLHKRLNKYNVNSHYSTLIGNMIATDTIN